MSEKIPEGSDVTEAMRDYWRRRAEVEAEAGEFRAAITEQCRLGRAHRLEAETYRPGSARRRR